MKTQAGSYEKIPSFKPVASGSIAVSYKGCHVFYTKFGNLGYISLLGLLIEYQPRMTGMPVIQ